MTKRKVLMLYYTCSGGLLNAGETEALEETKQTEEETKQTE